MTAIFILEVFIAKIYKGRGEALVPLVPTVLFTTAVPQILAAWQATAAAMTRFENHQTGRAHSASLTLKMFALQAFVAYGALTLSAFVYIPFGQTIMNRLIGAGYLAGSVSNAVQSGDLKYNADGNIQFDVNPSRMHTQLFAASVTSQATNAFTELLLPIILRKVAAWRQSRASGSADKINSGSTLVQNALSQLRLPTYEVFGDYAEMSTQVCQTFRSDAHIHADRVVASIVRKHRFMVDDLAFDAGHWLCEQFLRSTWRCCQTLCERAAPDPAARGIGRALARSSRECPGSGRFWSKLTT